MTSELEGFIVLTYEREILKVHCCSGDRVLPSASSLGMVGFTICVFIRLLGLLVFLDLGR